MSNSLAIEPSPYADAADISSALTGVLSGDAAGDALGLPMEGLSRLRQQRIFSRSLRHRLIFGRGMTSEKRMANVHSNYASNSHTAARSEK